MRLIKAHRHVQYSHFDLRTLRTHYQFYQPNAKIIILIKTTPTKKLIKSIIHQMINSHPNPNPNFFIIFDQYSLLCYNNQYQLHARCVKLPIIQQMGGCLDRLLSLFKLRKTYNISGKNLRQLNLIAEGGYGYVLLVQDTDSKKKYALKKLICQTEEQKASVHHEVEMMKRLSSCKHIVTFYGFHQIAREGYLQAYILMELADKTVYDLLVSSQKANRPIGQIQIIRIFKEAVRGVKEMHDLGIIHQDLKVENILISSNGMAKLCDLGSCTTEKIDLQIVPKSKMYHYQERFEKHTTLMYRPPEMIDLYLKYPVDDRVDIWMLGCVLYVLNYRFHPFQEEGKLSIVNANIKYGKGKVSQKMEDLMRHLLTPNPHFRPRVNEILSILENWDKIDNIPLNKVARIIKQDFQHQNKGQYQLISSGDWRSYKLDNHS